jgi:hypothetical protein
MISVRICSFFLVAMMFAVLASRTSPSSILTQNKRGGAKIPLGIRLCRWSHLRLRGGGVDSEGDGGKWTGREFEQADSGLDDELDDEMPPWPIQDENNKEEEIEMVKGMKETMRMGEDQ